MTRTVRRRSDQFGVARSRCHRIRAVAHLNAEQAEAGLGSRPEPTADNSASR